MIEPEVAYLELDGLMDLAEAFLTHIVTRVLEHHRADLKVIGRDVTKLEAVIASNPSPMPSAVTPVPSSLSSFTTIIPSPLASFAEGEGFASSTAAAENAAIATHPTSVGKGVSAARRAFPRLSYDEAHVMLDEAYKSGKLENPHKYGDDFGSPDETYISSQFDRPVMIHRYPARDQGVLHAA